MIFFTRANTNYYLILLLVLTISCKKKPIKTNTSITTEKKLTFHEKYLEEISKLPRLKETDTTNMVFLPSGSFSMGGVSRQARENELPQHKENVSEFWIDRHEVTNAQFKKFIDATNYITTAERKIEIEGKKYAPGALVFNGDNPNNWWLFIKGANWKHPFGPESSIDTKDEHPVVQVSWYDAMAYAHWVNKKLPSEVQYEFASRGKLQSNTYPWGNSYSDAHLNANFFQGKFPSKNTLNDKHEKTAKTGSYLPNSVGLYDISGNVWEWCLDTYYPDAYEKLDKRRAGYFSQHHNTQQQKVMRGGSYLCNESYCTGYRSSARMSSTPDTGLEHTGFRCVISL